MRTGKNNFNYSYKINGTDLNKSTCETMLDVNFDNLLNFDLTHL